MKDYKDTGWHARVSTAQTQADKTVNISLDIFIKSVEVGATISWMELRERCTHTFVSRLSAYKVCKRKLRCGK